MNIAFKLFASLLVLAASLPAVSGELPPAFNAVYRVEMSGLTLGEITIALEYEEGKYRYSKRTKTKGLMSFFRSDTITELSTGEFEGRNIKPTAYRYLHEKRGSNKESTVRFSADGDASGMSKDQPFNLAAPDDAFDRGSVELALMRDSGPEQLSYPVVQKGKLGQYTFRSKGDKSYDLPAGEFSCQEYEVERSTAVRRTSICLADDLYKLPVWATHDEKGKIMTMSLLRVEVADHAQSSTLTQYD